MVNLLSRNHRKKADCMKWVYPSTRWPITHLVIDFIDMNKPINKKQYDLVVTDSQS